MTDDSIMPWGIHKGKKMANVPAEYLLWIYNNIQTALAAQEVKDYIKDNLEILKQEAKQ